MAANQILSLPAAATGLAPVSSATAWNFGTAVTASASLPVGINIIGLQFQVTNIPTVDTTQEILFNITVGGVTKLQIPYTQRSDTAVGFYPSATYSGGTVFLPEPFSVAGGSAVAVQVTDSLSSAITYNGVKILYQENTPPTVALNTPNDVATGVSLTPDLLFTGTDADSDEIEYNVQVDTVNTFGSGNLLNKGSGASVRLIQSASNNGADTATATLATTPVQGNLLVASVYSSLTFAGVDISGWTIAKQINDGGLRSLSVFYKIAGAGESTSVTATSTGSGSTHVAVAEYQGLLTVGVLDKTISATSNATTVNSLSTGTSDATTKEDELIIAAAGIAGSGSAITYTNSLTNVVNTTRVTLGQKTVTATGTQETTIGFTGTAAVMNAILVTFKAIGTDATFTGTGDPHPWASGNQVTYTVQAGDILTTNTLYYWRARGTDPLGSNTYGDWSTTRSFTTTAGGITVKNLGLLGVG